MRKWIFRLVIGLFAILLLAASAFVIWAETPLGPQPQAIEALQSDEDVRVEETDLGLIFRPADSEPETGLIFYPGGRVDPRSYAPIARQIASAGYLVVVPKMPLNLAVFSPDRANSVIEAFPQIKYWAIGGHSLGGAMAARYASRNPEKVHGLALFAAYPAASDDLSSSPLEVVSIFGSRDGLADPGEVSQAQSLLPADTVWVEIPGGNHTQFGSYGDQPGDTAAELSREEQQLQAVSATLELLSRLEETGILVPADGGN